MVVSISGDYCTIRSKILRKRVNGNVIIISNRWKFVKYEEFFMKKWRLLAKMMPNILAENINLDISTGSAKRRLT